MASKNDAKAFLLPLAILVILTSSFRDRTLAQRHVHCTRNEHDRRPHLLEDQSSA